MQALGKQFDHDDTALLPSVHLGTDTFNKTIYGIDLERCGNDAAYQGINTKDGKVMTLTVNSAYNVDGTAANNIYNVFVVQVYDGIVNLRNGAVGCQRVISGTINDRHYRTCRKYARAHRFGPGEA